MSIKFKFIKTSDPEYQAERILRWEVLRKPLGLPPGSEYLPEDISSVHLVAMENKEVIGCVSFHPENNLKGRIFQLALSDSYKGKSFSRQLLHAMETFLIEQGYKDVYCEVSEDARAFYKSLGFTPDSENLMRKHLSQKEAI